VLALLLATGCFPAREIALPSLPGEAFFLGARDDDGTELYASPDAAAFAAGDATRIVVAPSPHSLEELRLAKGPLVPSDGAPVEGCGSLVLSRGLPRDDALELDDGLRWRPIADSPSFLLNAWLEPLALDGCPCVIDDGDTPLACSAECPEIVVEAPAPPDSVRPIGVATARTACGGLVELPGECVELGVPCRGPWPEAPPGASAVYYVRVGAAGDGSEGDPFGTIAEALAAAPPGSAILLGAGVHAVGPSIDRPGAIIGCAGTTTIASAGGAEIVVYQDLSMESVTIVADGLHAAAPVRLSGVRVLGRVAATETAITLSNVAIDGTRVGVEVSRSFASIDGLAITASAAISAMSSTVTARRLLVDGGVHGGVNGVVGDRSWIELERALIDGPGGIGVQALGGAVMLEDVAILRPGVFGIDVEIRARGPVIERVHVEAPGRTGILIHNEGVTAVATAALADAVVVAGDSAPEHGIHVMGAVRVALDRARIGGGFQRSALSIQGTEGGLPRAELRDIVTTASTGIAAIHVSTAEAVVDRARIDGPGVHGVLLDEPLSLTELRDLTVSGSSTGLTIEKAQDNEPSRLVAIVERAHLIGGAFGLALRKELNVSIRDVRVAPAGVGFIFEGATNPLNSVIEIDGLEIEGGEVGIDLSSIEPGATSLLLSRASVARSRIGARVDRCALPIVVGPDLVYRDNVRTVEAVAVQ
jgi:hypothetical protein